MKPRLFPTVLLFFSFFTSLAFSAEEATVPVLMPGRYVLVLRDNTDPDPLIVNVLKKDDSLLMSVENPDYADTAIRSEDGTVIFQLSRRYKAPQNANLQEELMTFAGVASARVPRAINGVFSCCSIYGKGHYDRANSPSIQTGTFQLFPIDKEK